MKPEEVYWQVCNNKDSLAQLERRFDIIELFRDTLEQKRSEGNTSTSEPKYYYPGEFDPGVA